MSWSLLYVFSLHSSSCCQGLSFFLFFFHSGWRGALGSLLFVVFPLTLISSVPILNMKSASSAPLLVCAQLLGDDLSTRLQTVVLSTSNSNGYDCTMVFFCLGFFFRKGGGGQTRYCFRIHLQYFVQVSWTAHYSYWIFFELCTWNSIGLKLLWISCVHKIGQAVHTGSGALVDCSVPDTAQMLSMYNEWLELGGKKKKSRRKYSKVTVCKTEKQSLK